MSLVNTRAEEAVIASLLIDPLQIPLISDKLHPEDFGDPAYGRAFEAMVALSREHRAVDTITLAARGAAIPDTLDILSASRGAGLLDHVALIRDASFRRQVHAEASSVLHATERGESPNEILARLTSLRQTASIGGDSKLMSAERAAEVYTAEMRKRKAQGVGLTYGISSLDKILQPAHGGDMVIVAARPSVGKTALAETIADHWASDADLPVLFVSIEMSMAQLMDRAVSRSAGIPAQHIIRGIMSADEEALALETLERRKSVKIWYVDDAYSTTETVRSAAARVALEKGGVRAIVVDYLQILKDPGENDNQRISKVSRNLKATAREFGCPILVLSQLNRQAEYREDPHPRLSDLRDSGAIEQDADVVLGLWRDRRMEDEFVDSDMHIDILKNRQGPSGVRILVPFDGDFVSFGGQ